MEAGYEEFYAKNFARICINDMGGSLMHLLIDELFISRKPLI